MMAADAESGSHGLSTTCIFCKISSKAKYNGPESSDNEQVIYANEELFVIEDIKPHAKHHYLVVPHAHVKNPKTLTKDDIPLVKRLMFAGEQVLKDKAGIDSLSDAKFGFHWPPFNSIEHLHLHVLYPWSEMSLFNRKIIFNTSLVFAQIDWFLQRLEECDSS